MTTLPSIPVQPGGCGKVPSKWEWKFPLTVWFISGLITQALGSLLQSLALIIPVNRINFYWGLPPVDDGWQGLTYGVWQRWDAIHYQRIAQFGYNTEDLGGFFPLYPLLGRLVSEFTNTHVLVGMLIVTNLAFAGALILIYRLTAEWFSPQLARYATVFLALFPFSYFFHAPFTESLALVFILGAIVAARSRRWAVAALMGVLAGLTRATVYPLALALAWMAWEEDRKLFPPSWRMLRYLAAAAPLAGNALFFQWLALNGFPTFVQIKEKYWEHTAAMPWEVFAALVQPHRARVIFPEFWFSLAALLFVIAINVWGWKRMPAALRIYQASLPVMILFNNGPYTPLYGFGRFSLLMFPNYILLAAWAHTPARRLAVVGVMLFAHLLLAGLYFMWWWTG